MAKPIKATPVLRTKNAIHFVAEVRNNESKKIPKEEVERGRIMHERMVARTR